MRPVNGSAIWRWLVALVVAPVVGAVGALLSMDRRSIDRELREAQQAAERNRRQVEENRRNIAVLDSRWGEIVRTLEKIEKTLERQRRDGG